jgi:hypothetical protein
MVLVALGRSFYDPAMTEAIAFDTHRFVKRLTESGFTEKQAETLAEEHVVLLNANLATKADIAGVRADTAEIKAGMEAFRQETMAGAEALRHETKANIARIEAGTEALRLETKAAIETIKADLLKWMFGALIAQGGLIVAFVRLL